MSRDNFEPRLIVNACLNGLTYFSLASCSYIGKQYSPDVTPQNGSSHLGLFCLHSDNLSKK